LILVDADIEVGDVREVAGQGLVAQPSGRRGAALFLVLEVSEEVPFEDRVGCINSVSARRVRGGLLTAR